MADVQEVPQDDFVTEKHGIMRRRVPRIRYLDTRRCELEVGQEHLVVADHKLLKGAQREGNEQKLAKSLGRDMQSEDWKGSVERLSSRGYIVHIFQEWNYKGCWEELPDAKKLINLTANGMYLGSQSLKDLGLEG